MPENMLYYGVGEGRIFGTDENMRMNIYLLKLMVSIISKMNVCNALHATITIERVDVAFFENQV